ncbi:MAG: acyl-[ACP]--phospholipid O-acyltransferase [Magnetococcales bacterium]|nr:acyl-[ACP]--phospholipid O-acyltransferase [Magnetococcales bacterium]
MNSRSDSDNNTSTRSFTLLAKRRFLPLFLTQALGAFNDNLFKNALVIMVTYRAMTLAGISTELMVTAAAGVFILPFFLFSATAGLIADRWDKARTIRWVKFGEVLIMVLAAFAFSMDRLDLLILVLFLMGTQSAFFGPLKYAILPDHLHESELIAGNALVEAGTFLAILLGTVAGGILIMGDQGVTYVSTGVIILALAGWGISLTIPSSRIGDPSLVIRPNIFKETAAILRFTTEKKEVFRSILGISWFWLVGATFLAQFPTFAKEVVGGDAGVVTLFLTLFSLGIGIGSILCQKLLKGSISAQYVPFGALGMSLFIFDLQAAAQGLNPLPGTTLLSVSTFLEQPLHWRIMVDLVMIAVNGGLFIVPLYAIMQERSDPDKRARVIAGNNVMNALFMVASALLTAVMLGQSFTVPEVFLAIGVVNLLVSVYVVALVPDTIIKMALQGLFKLLYRVEIKGLENLEKAGDKAVIVVNHVSFLDAPLLAAFLPEKPLFAINTQMAEKWWVKPFLRLVRAFPLDPTNPLSLRSLTRAVAEGGHCVIFPEGRLTVTGALMKIYEGPGVVADRSGATIVPIRIDGAQYSWFTRLRGKIRPRLFPTITLTVEAPRSLDLPEDLRGRARRKRIGTQLYDILCDIIVSTANRERTLFQALLDAREIHGGDHVVLEDLQRSPMDYSRLITASMVLGNQLAKGTERGERVGVLLPNASASAAVFFGLQAQGRVPAMLNFSAGPKSLASACRTATLKRVITSRRFVKLGKLEEAIDAMQSAGAHIIWLEESKEEIGWPQKVRGVVSTLLLRLRKNDPRISADDPAVVLFTSGSEGEPKGVVLSHKNILVNTLQLSSRIDYSPTDRVFNALPIFHAFGLTGGLLLPVLGGIRVFLYPSPLHYRIVPELAYDTNATILFGTDTFLSGYARMANPYDFYSVRHVFAGAEKVREETRRVWSERFGLRILEGYGATETAPALSTNTPMHCRTGSVGRLLPGISHALEPVPGIEAGGRLKVWGPNVMLGYLRPDNPGVLDAVSDGIYDTGDIVTIDEEGFVTIRGRAKRFAKIAGEMVSLGAVEEMASTLWPEAGNAVVALPDPRKGERLILMTTQPEANRKALADHARAQGASELMVPRTVRLIKALPVLGTGKTDYVTLNRMAEET